MTTSPTAQTGQVPRTDSIGTSLRTVSFEIGAIRNRIVLVFFLILAIVTVISSIGQLWWLLAILAQQPAAADATNVMQHLIVLKRIDVLFKAILLVTAVSLVNFGGLVLCLIGTGAIERDGTFREGSVSLASLLPMLLLIGAGVALAIVAIQGQSAGGPTSLIPGQ
jgi:hypothetical protein